MVVEKIDVNGVTFVKAKNNPPVGPDRDRLEPLEFALQGMKPKARTVQILWRIGGVQKCQNVPDALDHAGRQQLWVIVLVEALETLVPEAADHC